MKSCCTRPSEFRFVQASDNRWNMLRQSFESMRLLAERDSGEFDDARVHSSIQQLVLGERVLAPASRDEKARRRASLEGARRHTAIVRRAQQYLHEGEREPVYVLDLCRATGASERTLREAFQENCGLGPVHYLNLRRLREVHRRLRDSTGAETSVKAVALENGFWDLGRFAVEYRQLFGEPPSETLRRGSGEGLRIV